MQLLTEQYENLRSDSRECFSLALPPELRTITEFACEDIVCPPGGPAGGEDFTIERQPFAGLLFAAIESGEYVRFAVTGPLQSGKTFLFVIVALYYLFEVGEDIVYGIPIMDMARDKWDRDFLPVILASKWADQLPTTGPGSEGGKFEKIIFKNGKSLKFMSAKGGDAKRSGYTARVLIMTEVDKYDEAAEASRESDPVTQMIGRLEAHEMLDTLVFMECSTTIATGKIWKEFTNGTKSRIETPCPHCGNHVCMERENLKGWQQATNEIDARLMAYLECPKCQERWSEDDRKLANSQAVLVHRGQTVEPETGLITGESPMTYTLGFRWNTTNNLMKDAADLGYKEWKARNDPDEENSEKTLLQYTWAKPWNGESNATGIKPEIICERLSYVPQWELPEDTEVLVVQIDMHFKWHYYTIMASGRNPNPLWKEGAKSASGKPIPKFLPPHYSVIDYGLFINPDRARLGPEGSMAAGLELLIEELESRDYVMTDGRIVNLDLGLIDGGFHQDIALAFVTSDVGGIWRLVKGEGRKDLRGSTRYAAPKEPTREIYPGDHWYDKVQPACIASSGRPWRMIFSDTNYWMHQVHGGLMSLPFTEFDPKTATGVRRPGSIAIWGDDPEVHLRMVDSGVHRSAYATQLCGWIWAETKSKKAGQQVGWNKEYEQDHWLDTTYGCRVADSIVRKYARRFRPKIVMKKPKPTEAFTGLDGQPYLISNR